MEIDQQKWRLIKKLFTKAAFSSMHFSIATVNKEGHPHVTPVGSLFLTEPFKGFYFEEYLSGMKRNIEDNGKVCVLAVNSSKIFWLKSLIKGKFSAPLSIRLNGTAGARREATEREYRLLQKIVGPFRWTKGCQLLWKDLKYVREISFDSFDPVRAGKMSSHLPI